MKEKIRKSLVTYIMLLAITIVFVVIILFYFLKNKQSEEYSIRERLCNLLDDSVLSMIIAKTGVGTDPDFIEIDSYDFYKNTFLTDELKGIIREAEELNLKEIEKDLNMTEIEILNKMKEHSLVLFNGYEIYAYDKIKNDMNVILLYNDKSIPNMEIYKTGVDLEDYLKTIYNDWAEIKNELKRDEVFYATKVEKKKDKYVIKGKICVKYEFDKEDLIESIKNNEILIAETAYQIKKIEKDKYKVSNNEKLYYIYKENDKYYLKNDKQKNVWTLDNPSTYQITLNKNAICEDNISKEKKIVENKFENFKNRELDNTSLYYIDTEIIENQEFYKFEFRNGEFVKLISLNI